MRPEIHEVNNLIVSIQSIARLIKEGMMDDEMIEDLISRSERLKNLINSLTNSQN